MSLVNESSEYVIAAGKAVPPVTVTGLAIAGLSLNEWVVIVTLLYTVTQFGFLIYDRIKKYRNGGS